MDNKTVSELGGVADDSSSLLAFDATIDLLLAAMGNHDPRRTRRALDCVIRHAVLLDTGVAQLRLALKEKLDEFDGFRATLGGYELEPLKVIEYGDLGVFVGRSALCALSAMRKPYALQSASLVVRAIDLPEVVTREGASSALIAVGCYHIPYLPVAFDILAWSIDRFIAPERDRSLQKRALSHISKEANDEIERLLAQRVAAASQRSPGSEGKPSRVTVLAEMAHRVKSDHPDLTLEGVANVLDRFLGEKGSWEEGDYTTREDLEYASLARGLVERHGWKCKKVTPRRVHYAWKTAGYGKFPRGEYDEPL